MDHDRPVSAFGLRPNRRASTQLTIDEEGRRPLFSKPSRESLGSLNPAQAAPGATRFGFSPTNANAHTNGRPPSRAAAIPRPSSSASQTPSLNSNHSSEIISPGSRIPRPKSTIGIFAKGTGASVAEAWKLADENRVHTLERVRRVSPAIDGSPSPAPRPYLNRQPPDESKARQTRGKDAVDYSRPRPLSRLSSDSLRDSYATRHGGSPGSQHSLSSSGSFDRRLSQYEREMDQSPSLSRQPDHLFGRNRIGPKISETGQTLARKTSNGSLNGAQSLGRRASNSSLNGGQNLGRRTSYGSLSGSPRPPAFAKSHVPEGRIKELLDQDEKGVKRSSNSKPDWELAADTPLPSIEAGIVPQEPTPPTSRPASTNPEIRSPEKSYAWQLDADFTAGDLQFSDSPRIRMGGMTFGKVSDHRHSAGNANADNQGISGALESNGLSRRELSSEATSRAGRSYTKIDEIRQREEKANEELAELRRGQSRARNTRLEEIREREADAEEELAKQSKAQARSYYPTPDDLPMPEEVEEQPRPKNTKLDEIRAREAESLSKRAMASSRLEEIREQNSMSRSKSPEARRSNELARESTPAREVNRESRRPAKEEGEHVPNTPITIYRKAPLDRDNKPPTESTSGMRKELASPKSSRPQSHTRTDSRDLLQRLARAASSSPAPEVQDQLVKPDVAKKLVEDNEEKKERYDEVKLAPQHHRESFKEPQQESVSSQAQSKPAAEEQKEVTEEPVKKRDAPRRKSVREEPVQEPEPKPDPPQSSRRVGLKTSEPAYKTDNPQPSLKDESKASEPERPKSAVDFAARRRERRQRSTDSAKDSRKSMAMSDGDPTDRILQEMNLFAPADNQSERGSVRAQSAEPPTEEDEDKRLFADETPRPVKVDPLSLPTPKVTGAYVETPATVRIEKVEEDALPPFRPDTNPTTSHSRPPSRRGSRPPSRARSFSKAGESESETSDQREQGKEATATMTTSILRRRNRSSSRPRRPLINSVKPPTVKDDLLELQRIHQIDDSTLDDFEEMFNLQKLQNAPSPDIESMLDEISIKREEVAAKPNLTKTERDRELEQYDRMSKTLKDGLFNIRTAKQGIERLEGQVSHSEGKNDDSSAPTAKVGLSKTQQLAHKMHHHHSDHAQDCPDCIRQTPSKEVSYLHLPVPSLYKRKPFRLTSIGLILLLVSLWYAAESAVCELYCRPATCSSTPCVWSSTDPTWGTAIPVKLDEWATNGWGRQIFSQLSEDASDLWADAVDFATGTEITSVDINTLDFYEKRQHRRRLRKKGLVKRPAESAEDKAKWDAWHAARVANERVQEAREMGYDIGDADESFGDDEML
ncbi:hypothetical protein EsH8_VI_000334 [Colletotrichum jinshuiense]